jgi:hypothetical protein
MTKSCSVAGCQRPFLARNYCRFHYEELRRAGKMPKRTTAERFWPKVNKTAGCWEWTSTLNPTGYGTFHLKTTRPAHRVSWEMVNGPIPPGMSLDHICHNRKCVNPVHLRLATQNQNCENLVGAYSNSATGIRGVGWHKHKAAWVASVQHDGKPVHVGYFDDIAEAERAVTARRLELFTHNDADRGVIAEEVRMRPNA